MDSFMKIGNFNVCMNILEKYMHDTYEVNIRSYDSINVKELIYNSMVKVKQNPSYQNKSLRDLNKIVINDVANVYINKLKLSESKKPKLQNLDRETQIFGNRPISNSILMPENTNVSVDHATVTSNYERLINMRSKEDNKEGNIVNDFSSSIEDALSMEEFQNKLKLLEKNRDDYLNSSIDVQQPIVPDNPKAFFEQSPLVLLSNADEKLNLKENSLPYEVMNPNMVGKKSNDLKPLHTNHKQNDLIPYNEKRISLDKYIIINGFDRDWNIYKHRYKYTVNFNDLSQVYKNIVKIKFTNLILPMEIIEEKTIINVPKTTYYYENKLSVPYVMLQVDEFNDVFDGLNQQVKKCFTQFVFDSSYKGPNGRGYIIMKPAQDEQKTFKQHALSSLSKLSFTLIKPNGALYNNSIDNFNVIKLEYESYNNMYLKVVLDKYFDKNEFYIGDTVFIRKFMMPSPINLTNPCVNPNDYILVNEFTNRSEGHEIVQMGEPNESGFYRSFYILAPGELDQLQGKLVITKKSVDAIREYNALVPVNMAQPTLLGSIINASLQNSISMTLSVSRADVQQIVSQTV